MYLNKKPRKELVKKRISEEVQFVSFNSLSSAGGISTYIRTIRNGLGQKKPVLTFRIRGTNKFSTEEICINAKTFLSEICWLLPKKLKILIDTLNNTVILHFNPYTFSEILLLVLCRVFGKKIVITFHGNNLKNNELSLEKIRQTIVYNFSVLFGNKVIFVNKKQAQNAKKAIIFKKLLQKKKTVINNFVDEKIILKDTKPFISKTNIIFVGRLTKEKGYDDLMLLAQDKNLQNINFTIVGKRSFDQNILNRKNIKYYNVVPNNEIFAIYDKNNILILPSYSESFPLVILEAMARGLVVLVSDISGMREIVKEKRNAYFFSPGDIQEMKKIILFLKNNPEKIKEISRNNLKDIKAFTISKQIFRYVNLYKELLKEK